MTFKIKKLLPAALLAATALTAPILSTQAFAEDYVGDALKSGKLILDARLRYESVSQDGFANDASGLIMRTRLGYETGDFKGFKFLAEFESTSNVLDEDYNSVKNGNVAYPVIADPDSTELNRAQFTYTGVEDFAVIGGRQRINLGNQRFIGAVGWRQNEQTYDAIVLQNTSLEQATFTYAFIDRVHNVVNSRLDTVAHAVNVDVKAGPAGTVSAYGYFLDVEDAPAVSTSTMGVRVHGKYKQDNITFSWDGEYATQSDYGDNPADVDADFYSINFGAATNGFVGKVGYDVLGGDGTTSFTTPLATLHKWQGFADAFLATPADGIKDLHVTGSWSTKDVGPAKTLKLAAWYHTFEGDTGGVDMGSELDLLVAVGLGNGWSTSAKYADYSGEGFQADRQKLWLTVGYKY